MTGGLFRYLPRGGSLPSEVWKKRHQAMVFLLWAHVPALFVVGVATGHEALHVLLECSILVGCALASMTERFPRNLRMIASSIGLLTASAVLVHFSGGVIEMHFHFFVMVAAVTLYQAWMPFLVAIAYVVGQHGVMGAIDAASVYNHPAAVANPWKWAVVHGLFILGECVTLIVAWRLNEDSRAAAATEYESRLQEETARVAAQEAYGRIFENSMEGIYETTAAGFIMTANPALARILGYGSTDEMTGKPISEHYQDPSVRGTFLKLLDEQGTVMGFEFEARRIDGSSVWLSNNANVVRDETGQLISIQGMVEDITKRKEVETKKDDLETQLRQAQKMEAVGQLAGGVAHDFNNLLSIIQNYARFSMEGLEGDDARAQDLEEVLKASRRGADLVRQLIAFSRREVVVGQTLYLNDIVGELGKMLHRTLGESIALRTELDSGLWNIEADAGHMEQILMNLVLNARDAIVDHGEVVITTANHTVEDDSGLMTPGRYVVLSVEDNGCGMPPAVSDRIFEPFFTTKEVGSGTGLGLATVYGIVEHWNGHVTVKSEVGKGTEFLVYLPVSGSEMHPEVESVQPLTVARGNRSGRLLVVEDERSVLELVRRILSAQGYEVVTASSATEAIEKVDAESGAFDLFLSDMVMPQTSGRQLAAELEKRYPEVPMVFMTGYSDDVLAKHGAVDPRRVLNKPFTPEQLLEHVEGALRVEAVAGPT